MMKRKLTLWASMLAMLVFTGAASAKGVSDASLDKLMELSGIDKQISVIPVMVKAGMEAAKARAEQQQNSKLSGQDFDDLEKALGDAFQPDALRKATADAIRKKVSEADATQLIAWLQSDLGKKVTQAEVDASTPAARQDMMAHAQELLADKQRVAFGHRLEKLLHATDDAIKFRGRSAVAMYTVVNRKLHPDQPLDVKAFKARVDSALEKNRPNIETMAVLNYVYIYRNLDMATLKKYEAFLKHPATRRFNDSARAGLLDGVDEAVAKVADNIAAIAQRHKARDAGKGTDNAAKGK